MPRNGEWGVRDAEYATPNGNRAIRGGRFRLARRGDEGNLRLSDGYEQMDLANGSQRARAVRLRSSVCHEAHQRDAGHNAAQAKAPGRHLRLQGRAGTGELYSAKPGG